MIDFVNHVGSGWAQYFGPALIQNTLFLGLILLALQLLRKAPANLKCAICLVGFAKLLLPPLIPAWFLVGSAPPLLSPSGGMLTIPAGGMLTDTGALASHSPQLSLPGLLFVLWTAGAAFYLIYALVASLRLRAAVRRAVPLDTGALIRGWLRDGAGNQIEIYKSDRIAIPLTLGVFPSRIYVPEAWDRWSDRCRRMVISHEIAHIRRRDGLVQMLQIVVGAVYFFNPLVWWLNRQMNQYREMACDDAVVSGSARSAMEYSKYLVELAESVVRRPTVLGPASALLRCKNGLLRRVHYQLREGTMINISRRRRGIILVALLILIPPLSWYCGSAETKQDLSAAPDTVSLGKYKDMQIVQISVTTDRDGEISVDGEVVAPEDLRQKLDEIAGDNREKTLVFLEPGDLVRMEIIRKIQETLVDVGLRKVVYKKATPGFDDLTLILPSKEDQKRLNDIPKEYIAILEVRPGGRASLDGEPIDLWDVPEAIEKRLAENPELVVLIRSFGTGAFDGFATTLALVKKGGATRIAIDIPHTVE